jgi:hypothetical protein
MKHMFSLVLESWFVGTLFCIAQRSRKTPFPLFFVLIELVMVYSTRALLCVEASLRMSRLLMAHGHGFNAGA